MLTLYSMLSALVFLSMTITGGLTQSDGCEQLAELNASIDPCTCQENVLDCSAVERGSQLLTIDGLQNGVSIGFDTIKISNNPTITEIPSGAFGNHYATIRYQE